MDGIIIEKKKKKTKGLKDKKYIFYMIKRNILIIHS